MAEGARGSEDRSLLDAVRSRFDAKRTRIVLSGHSGGGSLIFGYLNDVEAIPDEVERTRIPRC